MELTNLGQKQECTLRQTNAVKVLALLTLAQLSISLTFSFSGSTSMANFRFLMVYSCPQNTFCRWTEHDLKSGSEEFEYLGHSGLFFFLCVLRREKREPGCGQSPHCMCVYSSRWLSLIWGHVSCRQPSEGGAQPWQISLLFPLTVSWGREPSTWVRLWYICSAVPSRNRPHPPINKVSPNNQRKAQSRPCHPTQQGQWTMCWSTRIHISSHSTWSWNIYDWCHMTWQWVCCTGCKQKCTFSTGSPALYVYRQRPVNTAGASVHSSSQTK